jgi:hypothetical protein
VRFLRASIRREVAAAVVSAAVAVAVSGCGGSSQPNAQQQQIAYQTRIGQINQSFIPPPADPARARSLLNRAIREYTALHPPPALRKLHRQVIAGLRGERRSLRDAELAVTTHDASALTAAEALAARSRRTVSRALTSIASVVAACRNDPRVC